MPSISTPTQALEAQQRDQEQLGQSFAFEDGPGSGQQSSGGGASGQNASGGGPPSLDLPRVQTNVQRPERDTERRDLMRLVQGLGALGTVAGAASDSSLATSVASGLTSGARQSMQRQEESFQRELGAYEEFVRSARQENRARRRAEAQADYKQSLSQYELEQEQKQERALIDQRSENRREEARLEDRLDEPSETEKAYQRSRADYYDARADYYSDRPTSSGSGDEDAIPDDPDALNRELETTNRQINAMQSRYNEVPTNVYGEPDQVRQRQIGRQIDALIKRRETLQTELERMQSGTRQGASGYTEGEMTENRDTVFSGGQSASQGPATPAAAPGRQSRPDQGPARQDSTQQAGGQQRGQGQQNRPRDASDQVPAELRTRILDEMPSDVDVREALNAAALVQSDTTDLTPAEFERAYGFNPFR